MNINSMQQIYAQKNQTGQSKQKAGFGLNVTIHPDLVNGIASSQLEEIAKKCLDYKQVCPHASVHFEPATANPDYYKISSKKIIEGTESKFTSMPFERNTFKKNIIAKTEEGVELAIKGLGLREDWMLKVYDNVFRTKPTEIK